MEIFEELKKFYKSRVPYVFELTTEGIYNNVSAEILMKLSFSFC